MGELIRELGMVAVILSGFLKAARIRYLASQPKSAETCDGKK